MRSDGQVEPVQEQLLRQACSQLEERLRAGNACGSEELLQAYPALAADPDAVLELLYTEFVLREQRGEQPTPEQWYARFPPWQNGLRQVFQIHQLARDGAGPDLDAGGNDAALSARVQALVRARQEAGNSPRGDPPAGPVGTVDVSHREGLGTVIGPYKLLQQIGEGGMGTVWMAEQTQPVQRKVALKIIKPGMDSRQVIARFEAERQALALMDHPNIAKVLEAGTTGTGRPYFVMELVKGVPMTRYCDERHLTLRERLELFVPVCHAVQHAHQKGIIHRDLKPSNVLVAQYDSRPVPKVIDFGVAKATGPKLTEKTLFTEFGAVVGTLEYMSPEQAELNQLDIDTRSDIYSLGVLLYELLTGTTPLERKRFQAVAFLEVLRLIREEESPKPSTRLSTTEGLLSIAANRGLEPKKLSGLVRGELDWIVMKCLEKDRNRRYETANGLAMDLQHHLADEPVEACPPSTGYRLRKFARRNKGPVLAITLVFLALVGGMVGTAWGLVRAEWARQAEAERAEGERQAKQDALAAAAAEQNAKEMAESREAETKAVLDFVQNKIFAAARPEGQEGGLGYKVTLRKAVEAALPFVEKNFMDKPLIEARLRLTLGVSFSYLSEAKIAAEQFQAARTIYTKHLGPDHADTLRSMNNLANSYNALGRHVEAIKLNEETLALRKAKLGPEDPATLSSMNNLAYSYNALGRHADARKLLEESLDLQKAKLGPEHPETLLSMHNLADTYSALGRRADAIKLLEETLTLRRAKLGPEHPLTLSSMHKLALDYFALGQHAEALKLLEETLALRKAKLGLEHQHTLSSMYRLANSYYAIGRHAEALKLLEETLALRKAKLGPDHPDTLSSIYNLAHRYDALGQHADAAKVAEELLRIPSAGWQDYQRAAKLLAHCAVLAEMDAKLSEADRKALAGTYAEQAKQLLGQATQRIANNPDAQKAVSEGYAVLARQLRESGNPSEAKEAYSLGIALFEKLVAEFPTNEEYRYSLAGNYHNLGTLLSGIGPPEEAEQAHRWACALWQKLAADFPKEPNYRYQLSYSHGNLGLVLAATGRPQEAEQAFRKMVTIAEKLLADYADVRDYFTAFGAHLKGLARHLGKSGKGAEARQILERAITQQQEHRQRNAGDASYRRVLRDWQLTLAETLIRLQEHREAAKTALELAQNSPDGANDVYDAACCLGLCVPLAEKDPKFPESERQVLAKEYADQAMDLLQEAIRKGFNDANHLKDDPDLASLRPRADFKKLLAELEEKKN